jgi:DHA1 family bicyclomycin/chloramphenicol resistance-like MFS transporter
VVIFLPQGQPPDKSVSLRPAPIIKTFTSILKQPQFLTYSLANAFSFSTLFVYVAGSPVIFMDIYQVTPKVYGGIFAGITGGFIASSQLNIWLTKRFSSEQIFRVALTIQLVGTTAFMAGGLLHVLTMGTTLALLFICLCCAGLTNPNATALALAPFNTNMGSASSLLGFIQLGIAALASGCIGLFDSKQMLPIVSLMFFTCVIAFVVFSIGKKAIGKTMVASD